VATIPVVSAIAAAAVVGTAAPVLRAERFAGAEVTAAVTAGAIAPEAFPADIPVALQGTTGAIRRGLPGAAGTMDLDTSQ